MMARQTIGSMASEHHRKGKTTVSHNEIEKCGGGEGDGNLFSGVMTHSSSSALSPPQLKGLALNILDRCQKHLNDSHAELRARSKAPCCVWLSAPCHSKLRHPFLICDGRPTSTIIIVRMMHVVLRWVPQSHFAECSPPNLPP